MHTPDEPSRSAKSSKAAMLESRLARLKLMIVNGSDPLAQVLTDMLAALGFASVTRAHNGDEAMHRLHLAPVHMIITDWDLEHRGGPKLLKRLRRRNAPAPFIPIILFAGSLTAEEALDARDAGVNGILLKPLDAKQFCTILYEVIASPRPFVTATGYRGPCRRHHAQKREPEQEERRRQDIRVIKWDAP